MNTLKIVKRTVLFLAVSIIGVTIPTQYAFTESNTINGVVYEFDEKCDYVLSEATQVTPSTVYSNSLGVFRIDGDIVPLGVSNGVASYKVNTGNISFYYDYNADLANASGDKWHVIDDNAKSVDVSKLNEKIRKGVAILQISNDHENWTNVVVSPNLFRDSLPTDAPFYESLDVQLLNGCYYRFIAAYEIERTIGQSKVLFFNKDKVEQKRLAEVYELYAATTDTVSVSNEAYILTADSKKVSGSKGYSNEQDLKLGDTQYGWSLGSFCITGYTSINNDNGTPIVLKNVGDSPTLWFKLNYDIDNLYENPSLKIVADSDGYDQEFQTQHADFGRGAMFIRYTDPLNETRTNTYFDFLNATATVGADAKVILLEEGDYDIALDYAIQNDKIVLFNQSILPQTAHYRMRFKFSVRNGFANVFPMDLKTGEELQSGSITSNGFKIDLARSRYLDISIKREVLTDGYDGLTLDPRYDRIAYDGAEITEEGVYTISAANRYITNQTIEKKIYVGSNNVIKAYMVTGLPISEINQLLDQGAIVNEDGTITIPDEPEVAEEQVSDENDTDTSNEPNDGETVSEPNDIIVSDNAGETEIEKPATMPIGAFAVVAVAIVVFVWFILNKHKKDKVKVAMDYTDSFDNREDREGK